MIIPSLLLALVFTYQPDSGAALVALPDGQRLRAVSASAGTVALGETVEMNGVSLQPVAVEDITNDVSVSVDFVSGATVYAGVPSRVIREEIRARVVNPEDVPIRTTVRRAAFSSTSASISTSPTDFLIVSPPAYTNLWSAYASFRQANHKDLAFKVVNTFDIYEDYPIDAASGVRNYAESIHKYLREHVPAEGISYVLLGGSWVNAQALDTTTDGRTITNCVPGVLVHPYNETFPSDTFYACLDLKDGHKYPWTATADESTNTWTYFSSAARGENDAGVDVIVARMPFKSFTLNSHTYTPEEIFAGFTNRLARAEGDAFDGTGRLAMVADKRYTATTRDGSQPREYEFYDDVPNFFAADNPVGAYADTDVPLRQVVSDHIVKYRPITAVDYMSAQSWTRGYATAAAAKAAMLARDHDLGGNMSHGYSGSAVLNTGDLLGSTGLGLLLNMSIACNTGAQQGSSVCVGEAAVESPRGGYLASVNNAGEGLSGNLGADTWSEKIAHMVYRSFLHRNVDAGAAWLQAHLEYLSLSLSSGFATATKNDYDAHCLVSHTLYGDPLVKARAPADGSAAETDFPTFATNAVFASDYSMVAVRGTNAVLNVEAKGEVIFAKATDAAVGRMKVMDTLKTSGTDVSFLGVEGGVGSGVIFTGNAGKLEIASTGRFYLGGVENCEEILVTGTNAVINCDNLDSTLKTICFYQAPGVTNRLQGAKGDTLQGVEIIVSGGTLVLDTADVLGSTSVKLSDGARIVLGTDPNEGPSSYSGETLNATFSGEGAIVLPAITHHEKKDQYGYKISGSVSVVDEGSLESFRSQMLGTASYTGDITSWSWECDSRRVTHTYGSVQQTSVSAKTAPYATWTGSNRGTIALYADLQDMAASATLPRVLVSVGPKLLLCLSPSNTVDLVQDGTGTVLSRPKPSAGLHLFTFTWSPWYGCTLAIDDAAPVANTSAFPTIEKGLQLGSRYGGVGSYAAGDGLDLAAVRGYWVPLTAEEIKALAAEMPAVPESESKEEGKVGLPVEITLAFKMTADDQMQVGYEINTNGVSTKWDDAEFTFVSGENFWRGNGNTAIDGTGAILVKNFSGYWNGYPVPNTNLEAGGTPAGRFWEIDVPFDLRGSYAVTNMLPKAFITNKAGSSDATNQPLSYNKQFDVNVHYLTVDKTVTNQTAEVHTVALGETAVNTVSALYETVLSNGVLRIRMDNASVSKGCFGGIQGIVFTGVLAESADGGDWIEDGDNLISKDLKEVKVVVNGVTNDISAAFSTVERGADGKLSYTLDAKGEVTIAGETITVLPVLSVITNDAYVADAPFVVTEGQIAVGVKSIPGLTYQLRRRRDASSTGSDEQVDEETAKGPRVKLVDDTDTRPSDKAFYIIRVTR